MPSLYIQVLIEDTAHRRHLHGEHGLSFWIRHNDKDILFDTGQSSGFNENAHKLGVNLESAQAIIFSHGHYDHVGGAITALKAATSATLYLHPDALEGKFAGQPANMREVGITAEIREHLSSQRHRLRLITKPTEILPGAFLTGPIPRESKFEDTGGKFFNDSTGTVMDSILDDMAISFTTKEGLVVIVGCAHAGIVNTLNYIASQHHDQKIHAVIGGFHLVNATEDRLQKTIEALKDFPECTFHPNHCTGFRATIALVNAFGKRCRPIHTGDSLNFS